MYNEHGYSIVDDALDIDDYKKLKVHIQNNSWKFLTNTAGSKVKIDEDSLYKSSFYQILHSDKNMGEEKKKPIDQICVPFVNCITKFFHLEQVIRIRAGLTLPQERTIVHGPHTDFDSPHHTALFYFCTEKDAGETYIYDQKYDPYIYKKWDDQLDATKDTIKVLDKVEAKENRCLFFNGNVVHSSTSPQSIYQRIAVNINFTGWLRNT